MIKIIVLHLAEVKICKPQFQNLIVPYKKSEFFLFPGVVQVFWGSPCFLLHIDPGAGVPETHTAPLSGCCERNHQEEALISPLT